MSEGGFEATTIRSAYASVADEYAATFADDLANLELDRGILDLVAEHCRGVGPVLDIGCGPAPVSGYLLGRQVEVVGIDFTPPMLAVARRRIPLLRVAIGDLHALPIRGGSIAGVVAYYVLQHVPRSELRRTLLEVRRVLAHDGLFAAAFHQGDGEFQVGSVTATRFPRRNSASNSPMHPCPFRPSIAATRCRTSTRAIGATSLLALPDCRQPVSSSPSLGESLQTGQHVRVGRQCIRTYPRVGCAVIVLVLISSSCSRNHDTAQPVGDGEARTALNVLYSIAETRTPAAMKHLCEMSLDHCSGLSSAVQYEPAGAPGPGKRPKVLCSRDVGSGFWMLVVEGRDGRDRPYTSQVVFGRDGKRVVPVREPTFWLGVAYGSTKVVGSTSWSTAYNASGTMAPAHTAEVLAEARSACARTSPTRSAGS